MNSFYPDIQAGDIVLFATNPNANDCQFRAGVVSIAKTDSCDIAVLGKTIEHRHDCLHIDDPQCKTSTVWMEPGRGVFKLSPREIDRRDKDRQLHALREQVAATNDKYLVAMAKMDSLEKYLESMSMRRGAAKTANAR